MQQIKSLLKLICVLLSLSLLDAQWRAFAQSDSTDSSNQQDAAKKRQSLESAIERRAKDLLHSKVDDFVSRRLDKESYVIDVGVSINKQKLNNLLASFGDAELGVLRESITHQNYEELRQYLSEANVSLGFSDRLSQAEWQTLSRNLEEHLTPSSGQALESIETKVVPMPASAVERAIEKKASEARKTIDYEVVKRERSDLKVKKAESQFRKDEIQLQHELELQRNKKLENDLKSDLEAENPHRRQGQL